MTNDRIGVYVCHCGGNISDVVDVEKVVEAIKNYPGVVVAKHFMFMCSEAGQQMIEEDIKQHKLNAVVVAACSPKLHETTFRNAAARAGLNPYVVYHVNIREQASWAHSDDKEKATLKAIRHVKAGIEYVRNAHPLDKIKVKTTPRVLVVGGGIAGMRAALDLADSGITVYLVEKEPFLGGEVAKIWRTYPTNESGIDIVKKLTEEVKKNENIIVYTNADIEKVTGYIGNFVVEVKLKPRYVVKDHPKMDEAIEACPVEAPDEFNYGLTKRKAIYKPYPEAYPSLPVIDMEHCTKCGECVKIVGDAINLEQKEESVKVNVGAIIVATGFMNYVPKEGEYGYKIYPEVVTLYEFERLLAINGKPEKLIYNGKEIKSIAFIYCVGSRQTPKGDEPVNEYCSRYCCNAAMYVSSRLLEKYKHLNIFHLYRDIRTYGKNEFYYLDAGRKGVRFIRFSEDNPPTVEKDGEALIVKVKDTLTGNIDLDVPVDMVVLVTGMVARENKKLEQLLKLPIGSDKFYKEVHPKLRPVETSIGGILLAGAAQGPKDIMETLLSASAAAAKAATIVLQPFLELEPSVAEVDIDKCNASGLCIQECPSNAISFKEYEGKGKKAFVNEALCIGCGACTAVCPTEAIQLKLLTNKQIREMIRAMAEPEFKWVKKEA
ncbi:MAG: CoB--CoM heterodisulfide reductase iron-sulfur subunit A family protein [Candidatus Njordarchaeia archaeon]